MKISKHWWLSAGTVAAIWVLGWQIGAQNLWEDNAETTVELVEPTDEPEVSTSVSNGLEQDWDEESQSPSPTTSSTTQKSATPSAAPSGVSDTRAPSEKPPSLPGGGPSTPKMKGGYVDGVFEGENVPYDYGSLQVTVTIKDGKITQTTEKATATESTSKSIQDKAFVVLRKSVIAVQSEKVSNVSGATFTTEAYKSSLQSALDQARK